MKNLPNLYPLRFFLSVCVILFHLPLISKTLQIPAFNDLAIFNRGVLSVYYFFALSGFLIFRLIYIELKESDKFDFKRFYVRRIQRLYPVYYLVLLIGILIYYVILPRLGIHHNEKLSLFKLILSYCFLIPNVFRYYNPEVGSILVVFWSIGVEEQFYLFIPVFLYVFKKHVVSSIIGLLIILLLILIFLPSFYSYSNYYYYFLGGGLMSIVSLRSNVKLLHNKLLHLAVYALFILSFFTDYLIFSNSIVYHLFNLVESSLLVSLISAYPIFVIKSNYIDYLGKISYGIYMYHMIVITGTLFLVNKLKPYAYINHAVFILMLNIAVITLSAIIAHLSFKYFESRFYKPHPGKLLKKP